MTRQEQESFKKAFFFGLVILGVALIVVRYKQSSKIYPPNLVPNVPIDKSNLPFLQPPKPEVTDIHSSDGKMKLTMKTETTKEGTIYTFVVSNIDGTNEKTIYIQTVDPGTGFSFALPFNSWSPNNKYLFIREERAGLSFLVFKANGEAFAKDQVFYDVAQLFTARQLKYNLKDVTGWASNTLLIVTTTKDDGTDGPSFWFDLDSKAFLQLRS